VAKPKHRPDSRIVAQPQSNRRRRAGASLYNRAIAARTRSGVYGAVRILTPVASNMAFESADGTTAQIGSPAPHAGASGRSSSAISIFGTALNSGAGNYRESLMIGVETGER
jgi:hypothetical protein